MNNDVAEHVAYIGFGSNLGDPEKNCRQGLDMLGKGADCRVEKVSPLFLTEPVGYANQGWFVNGVARISTNLSPLQLLERLKKIEALMGRMTGGVRNGPRELDMDVLFFDDEQIDVPGLTVPHPRLHERRFVLAPLSELEPKLVHPTLQKSVHQLLQELPPDGQVKNMP